MLVDPSHLLEVYLVFEVKESGSEYLIGLITNKERAERFHKSERFIVRIEVVNPLDGSYLAMCEKEMLATETA